MAGTGNLDIDIYYFQLQLITQYNLVILVP